MRDKPGKDEVGKVLAWKADVFVLALIDPTSQDGG